MTETDSHWSVPVIVEDIPDSGLHVEIEAPAAARAAVAALASVRDLPELSAVFDLTRQGAGVHVAGQVKARVCQTCVVSLEPFETVCAALRQLRGAAKELGCTLPEPFLQVAFLALPVIPHLKITDRGLFDVDRFCLED